MPEEFIEDILSETESSKDLVKSSEDIIDDKTDVNADTKTKTDIKDNTNIEDKTEQKVGDDENEVTIEDLATQIGWNANYDGEDSVDAATYILKSREIQDTMKDHNTDLKTQLAEMKNSINDLKNHNERVYRTDVKRMQNELNSLKIQKREAVELADIVKVDEIDKQIDDLQRDLDKPEIKETVSSNPVFDEWIKDNQWYLNNPEMATYAETIAEQYEGAPLDRIYKIVRQKTMEVFPENFNDKKTVLTNKETNQSDNEGKAIGPKDPVEAAKNNKTKSNFTKADLTPDQIAIMNQFAKLGVMTEEQYIKDIVKMHEEG